MFLIVVFLKLLHCLGSPLVDYKNVHINSFLELHLCSQMKIISAHVVCWLGVRVMITHIIDSTYH